MSQPEGQRETGHGPGKGWEVQSALWAQGCGIGCWGLDAGGWVLGAGSLRIGSWGLDAGGLGAGGWMLGGWMLRC